MNRKQFPMVLVAIVVAGCTTPEAQLLSSGKLGQADVDFSDSSYQIVQLDNQEGKLAATKASDPRIRDLSSQVMAQASVLAPQVQSVLRAEGIKPANRPSPEVTAKVQKLSSLEGAAFDRQFLADQIDSHQRAVTVFQKEDKATQDGALRAEVETVLSVVQGNLTKLQYISGDLNGSQS